MPDIIVAIQSYIDRNYASQITLDALSRSFGISKYHMSREFKRYIGKSPNDYLIDLRLDRAKSLLVDSGRTIADIGQLVGIPNTNHFLYLFKSREGITPSALPQAEDMKSPRNRAVPGVLAVRISVAEADANVPGHLDKRVVGGQELGAAGGVLERDGDYLPVADADHGGVLLVHDEVRGGGAELGGQHAVVGAGRARPSDSGRAR